MPSIGVLEHFQKPTDKPTRRIKRSGGQSLVNRGLAYWITENVLLQMILAQASTNHLNPTPIGVAHSRRTFAEPSGPSQSPRMGKLKWEPPKNKRTPKGHPWQHFGAITKTSVSFGADQRSV